MSSSDKNSRIYLSDLERNIILNFRRGDKLAKVMVLRALDMDKEAEKAKFSIIDYTKEKGKE